MKSVGELSTLAYEAGFSYDARGGDQFRVTFRETGGDCGAVFVGTVDECIAFVRGWHMSRCRFQEAAKKS